MFLCHYGFQFQTETSLNFEKLNAKLAAPIAPAISPQVAFKIFVLWPPGRHSYSFMKRSKGSNNSSSACEIPPPSTITSGERILAMEQSPKARCRTDLSQISFASASPLLYASINCCVDVNFPLLRFSIV